MIVEDVNHVVKNLVGSVINTTTAFATEAWQETFEIQSSPLNCDLKCPLNCYILKSKVCGEAPYVGKSNTEFRYGLYN